MSPCQLCSSGFFWFCKYIQKTLSRRAYSNSQVVACVRLIYGICSCSYLLCTTATIPFCCRKCISRSTLYYTYYIYIKYSFVGHSVLFANTCVIHARFQNHFMYINISANKHANGPVRYIWMSAWKYSLVTRSYCM